MCLNNTLCQPNHSTNEIIFFIMNWLMRYILIIYRCCTITAILAYALSFIFNTDFEGFNFTLNKQINLLTMAGNPDQAFQNSIDILLEDTNGAHVFSNERATYGYIAAGLFLVLPTGVNLDNPMNANLITYGNAEGVSANLGPAGNQFRVDNPYLGGNALSNLNMMKIVLVNFIKLRNAGVNDESAWSISNLRARWVSLGCYYRNVRDRAVTFTETLMVNGQDVDVGQIVGANDAAALVATQQYLAIRDVMNRVSVHEFYGTSFAVNYAETIWCISELVFRIRGHHYKPEYEALIARTFRATTQGTVELPDNYDFASIFHTAIHPFGVRALPVMAYKFMVLGKVGESLITRFSGAPTGTAIFTTTSAGIKMLSGESMYKRFEDTYRESINACHAFAEQIMNNKYSYHISAGLYGLQRVTTLTWNTKIYTIQEAEMLVIPLSPMLKGFVDTVNQVMQNNPALSFSFGNQKVFDKRAAANPLSQIRMSTLVEKIITTLEGAKSSDEIMDTFLNKVNAPAPTIAPVATPAPVNP